MIYPITKERSMKWTYTACLLIFLIVFVFVFPALAGGWAVITLEEFPASLIAGQSSTIRFMVRQHGITPMKDLDPKLQLKNSQTGEAFTVRASPALGKTGLYQAEFSIPTQGTREWSIQAFTMDQRMPDLVVSEGIAGPPPAPQQPITPPVISTLAGILMATVSAGVAIRRRARWAVALAGLASAMSQQKPESAKSVGNPNHLGSALSGESGGILFVAKGCLSCHYNSKIDPKYIDFRSDIGPDLSNYAGSPEFLRLWLADPASVRADANMPDLELDAPEMEALIAYLLEGNEY
jgi:hypothetical protein